MIMMITAASAQQSWASGRGERGMDSWWVSSAIYAVDALLMDALSRECRRNCGATPYYPAYFHCEIVLARKAKKGGVSLDLKDMSAQKWHNCC